MKGSPWGYFKRAWNWVDLVSILGTVFFCVAGFFSCVRMGQGAWVLLLQDQHLH